MTTWLDELRVVKGQAIWTSSFTPQVTPYTNGGDIAAFTGTVTDPVADATGSLAVTEAASTAVITGTVAWAARLAATEAADTTVITGAVAWAARLAATEAADASVLTGKVEWKATLAVTETADVAALTGTVGAAGITASLAATEAADRISGAAATLAFQQAVATAGGTTPHTISFTVASAAGQERLVALLSITQGWNTVNFASVLIDGQTATQVGPYVSHADGNSANGPLVSFWRAAGTANTSINVTFDIINAGVYDVRGVVWTLNNVGSLYDYGTYGKGNPFVPGDENLQLDVDTVAGGVAAAAFIGYATGSKTATWTGLTERYDGTADSLYGTDWVSAADLIVGTASTPLTVTAATDMGSGATGTAVAGLAVSFNPAAVAGVFSGTVVWLTTLAATEAPDVAAISGPVVWAARLAAFEADQYDLLLHLNGADGSTVIVDSGGSSRTVTAHGAAQIDNSLTVFNGEALLVASDADYVSVDDGNHDFGTSDFTIDFRVRLTSASAAQMFYNGGVNSPKIYYNGSALVYESAAGVILGSGLSADTNYHIAATRGAGLTKLWKDGVQQGSTLADTASYEASSGYPQIGGAASPTLPAGVTLRAIDGETMTSSTTMSHNYFSNHGFNAAWDSPSFYPIGVWRPQIENNTHAAMYNDLAINVALGSMATPSSSWVTIMGTHGIYFLPESNAYSFTNTNISGNSGYDEPLDLSTMTTWVTTTLDTYQTGRFWFQNFTWAVCDRKGDINCVTLAPPPTTETILATNTSTPLGVPRHPDIICQDSYWFNAAYTYPGAPVSWVPGTLGDHLYLSGPLTVDEMARGSRYGDLVDMMRLKCTTYSIPIGMFIENGGPADPCATTTFIKPVEMNAAIWSSIIHGCRFPIYFNVTFGPSGGAYTCFDNFGNSYYQSPQNSQPISIYNQAKATNTLVASLATVINSPFADGFASVSPGATPFVIDNSFEIMCKYHKGADNKFYIFALPRHSATATSITATFTIKNTGATQVTVINESRTISVTSGTTFTDNFATGNTVHIYRVD